MEGIGEEIAGSGNSTKKYINMEADYQHSKKYKKMMTLADS